MDQVMIIAEQAIAALEQAVGLPWPALVGGVIALMIVLNVIVRSICRKIANNRKAKQEPEPLKITDARPENAKQSPALLGYQSILDEKGIDVTLQHGLVQDYKAQLDGFYHRMDDICANGEALIQRMSEARLALDNGKIIETIKILNTVGDIEIESGRNLRLEAERRLLSAAQSYIVAGDLELAGCDAVAASEKYKLAIEAMPLGQETLLAECLNKHGAAEYKAGNIDIAILSFRRAVKLLERTKGLHHQDVATAINNLAMLQYSRGDLAAAEPLYKRALTIDLEAMGEDSSEVATDLNNLALLMKKQDRLDEAESHMQRSLGIKEKIFEPDHSSLITSFKNYAAILRLQGRDEEAETFESRAAGQSPVSQSQANQSSGDQPLEATKED